MALLAIRECACVAVETVGSVVRLVGPGGTAILADADPLLVEQLEAAGFEAWLQPDEREYRIVAPGR